MKILFEVTNKKKRVDILQNILDEYNFKDKRGSIGVTPSEVNKLNENLVLRTLFEQLNEQSKVKFKVGDRVRIKFKAPIVINTTPTGLEKFLKIKKYLTQTL